MHPSGTCPSRVVLGASQRSTGHAAPDSGSAITSALITILKNTTKQPNQLVPSCDGQRRRRNTPAPNPQPQRAGRKKCASLQGLSGRRVRRANGQDCHVGGLPVARATRPRGQRGGQEDVNGLDTRNQIRQQRSVGPPCLTDHGRHGNTVRDIDRAGYVSNIIRTCARAAIVFCCRHGATSADR